MRNLEEELIVMLMQRQREHKKEEVATLIAILEQAHPNYEYSFNYCGESLQGNQYFVCNIRGSKSYMKLAVINWYTESSAILVDTFDGKYYEADWYTEGDNTK